VRLVKPGGYLAYMTCTYSPQENEENCRWLMTQYPGLQPVVVPDLAFAQSHVAEFPCYRCWPQAGMGAGAFTCLWHVRRQGAGANLPWSWLAQVAVARLEAKPWEP